MKKKKTSNPNRKWQELWSSKYTWSEGEFINEILVAVICTICIVVEGRKKSIVSKNDTSLNIKEKEHVMLMGIRSLI